MEVTLLIIMNEEKFLFHLITIKSHFIKTEKFVCFFITNLIILENEEKYDIIQSVNHDKRKI